MGQWANVPMSQCANWTCIINLNFNQIIMRKPLSLALPVILMACKHTCKGIVRDIAVIPKPQSAILHQNHFTLTHSTKLAFDQPIPVSRISPIS